MTATAIATPVQSASFTNEMIRLWQLGVRSGAGSGQDQASLGQVVASPPEIPEGHRHGRNVDSFRVVSDLHPVGLLTSPNK